ncbi:MAG: CDP-glycerol glycerophosphotransferase family protein [Oscillospiraceae bacterium]|jgi:CDP-ribitol ribitolphosphotransferase|nr:CDP-glycerol glycerophosphotransferase family protein [Oscillospiraceae bacterium]
MKHNKKGQSEPREYMHKTKAKQKPEDSEQTADFYKRDAQTGLLYDHDGNLIENIVYTDEIFVKSICWHRTHMHIEYTAKKHTQLYLFNRKKGIIIPLESSLQENGDYSAHLNFCIANGGRELPQNGGYSLFAGDTCKIVYSNEVLHNLENLARVFSYQNLKYAYVVVFRIRKNADDTMRLVVLVRYMMQNLKPQKNRPFLENQTIFKALKRIFQNHKERICRIFYKIARGLRKPLHQRILLMTENREELSGNLKALHRRLLEQGLDKDFKIMTSARNSIDYNQNIFSWLKTVFMIAHSEYIFLDDYTPIFALLNLKNTELVQLWHAGVGFKCVGYSRFGLPGSPHPYKSCHRHYTYGIVGSEDLRELYAEVWGIEKDSIIATGLPRLEHFLDDDIAAAETQRIYSSYPVLKGNQVVLFAPTFRGATQQNAYYDYSKIDFEKFYEYAKKSNSIVVFKMHHFIKEEVPIPEEFSDRLVEIKNEDINSLYYISDILITDYSSCFYDFSLLQRPILFYAYDKELYFASRGMHRSFDESAPGKVCETFDSLIDALDNKDFENPLCKINIEDRAVKRQGLASDIIIDKIILKK